MFIQKNSNYLVKVKIYIGTLLGCETDEEAYIEMKELDTQSMIQVKNKSEAGEAEFLDYMKKKLPEIIVNHNLYKDENKLLSNEEVAELIFSKMDLTSKVLGDYTKQAFRVPDNRGPKEDKKSL